MHSYLQKCADDAELTLNHISHWMTDQTLIDDASSRRLSPSLHHVHDTSKELVMEMASMVQTIEKQLADFMPGGIYGSKGAEPHVVRPCHPPVM
jgi:hypothetical protein